MSEEPHPAQLVQCSVRGVGCCRMLCVVMQAQTKDTASQVVWVSSVEDSSAHAC